MVRSPNRAPTPARWHLTASWRLFPFWSRRLTSGAFADHDFVVNSAARSEFPVEAFEIRYQDGDDIIGVVWSVQDSRYEGDRFIWSAVDWRFEVHRLRFPDVDPRLVRHWRTKDEVAEALLSIDYNRRRNRGAESKAVREAEALTDFYI